MFVSIASSNRVCISLFKPLYSECAGSAGLDRTISSAGHIARREGGGMFHDQDPILYHKVWGDMALSSG